MGRRIVGIVGSYRKGGTIDNAVSEILDAARGAGAQTETIYLLDRHVEFCTNCRSCTQQPGSTRGKCVQDDDMGSLLDRLEEADAIVLGAPVNCFQVNALFKRFQERLICYTYWPWGQAGPRMRTKTSRRDAVLVTSSAMPAFMGRIATGAIRSLRITAANLGARKAGTLYVGMAAGREHQPLREKTRMKARRLGERLA